MRNTLFPPPHLGNVEATSSAPIESPSSAPTAQTPFLPTGTVKREAEAMPTLPQLLESFDTTDIPGIESVLHDPNTGTPLWEDSGARFQKPFVRVFTLNSLHEKYKGISLEQRLDNEIEAATTGGTLRTADNRINQVGVASTRLGTGIWQVWGGEIGFLFSPDTPVSLKSKKDFYSNGLTREKCYQDALNKKTQGAGSDFAAVHRQADKNRKRGSRMLEKGDVRNLALLSPALKKLEKRGKNWQGGRRRRIEIRQRRATPPEGKRLALSL